MEKRKLLLVIISVGIFLVVVVGASIFVFAPKAGDVQRVSVSAKQPIAPGSTEPQGLRSTPASVDATEWVKNPQTVQGLQTPPPGVSTTRGDVIIIYGDNPAQTKALVGDTAELPIQNLKADGKLADGRLADGRLADGRLADGRLADGSLVIEVPKPAVSTVPKETVPALSQTQTEQKATQSPATAPAPASGTAKPAAATQKPAAAATAAKPAPVQKAQTKTYEDYWIQAGSFTAKARAESARTVLSGKGIRSVMEIKDINGTTYYRVRVGPYTSKSEAEYWLSLVKIIDGFDKSYVSMVKTQR